MRERNLTVGTPWKLILRFAVPLMIGNLFQQLYNMVDAFVISRALGVEAFAGVSCTSGLANLIIGFASGMTGGLVIPMAQAFGADDRRAVRKIYYNDLLICLIVSALVTTASLLGTRSLLTIMRTPAEIIGYAQDYLRVLFAGIIASMFFNFFANALRALGDSRSPLKYLLIACGVNIVLDILLVRFTPLGVRGTALATVASQAVSVLLCVRRIRKSVEILSLRGVSRRPDPAVMLRSLRLGLPMAFQSSIISLGVILIQFATNGMGTIAIASYSVAQKIDGVGVEPLRSLGLAMSTYTAQNYGADRRDRILAGVKQCVQLSLGMSILLGLVLCLGGRAITALFVGWEQKEILDLAHTFLTIHGSLYIILALLFDFRFTLQGLGSAMIPTIAGLMELGMRAFSAFVLVPRMGFMGASIETPLSWIGALIPVLIAWRLAARKLAHEI